jgi:steroid delta-isomerase-like uncharacterized protein
MSAEHNKALLRRYIEAVWDKENPDALDDFLATTYRRHRSPTTTPLSRDGQKQLLTAFRSAFPDIKITVEEVIAEGDTVAFRSTMRGTHQGEFLGIAPTGQQVTFSLLDVIRIEDGKIVEQWGGPDTFDLVQRDRKERSVGRARRILQIAVDVFCHCHVRAAHSHDACARQDGALMQIDGVLAGRDRLAVGIEGTIGLGAGCPQGEQTEGRS